MVDITTPMIKNYIASRMEWTCNECGENFERQNICPGKTGTLVKSFQILYTASKPLSEHVAWLKTI
jgi:hypothetical protein